MNIDDLFIEEFSVELDSAVYSLPAIKRASYDFTDRAVFVIEPRCPSKILVRMTTKTGVSEKDKIIAQFLNNILDHQIRLEIENECRIIREIIVAQAFAPCENLKEMVETIKP